MISIYTFDPYDNRLTRLNADLARRTVSAVEDTDAISPVGEFNRQHPEHPSGGPGWEQSREYAEEESAGGDAAEQTAAAIMTEPVVTLSATETVAQGLALLARHGISHLPITRDERVIGLLEREGLLQAASPDQPLETLAGPFLIVLPSIPVSAIALAFLTQGYSACMVRMPAGLRGLITIHDLLLTLLPELPEHTA